MTCRRLRRLIFVALCFIQSACDKNPAAGIPIKVPSKIKFTRERNNLTAKPVAFETVRLPVTPGFLTGYRVERGAGVDENSVRIDVMSTGGGLQIDSVNNFQPYRTTRFSDAKEFVMQCKLTLFEVETDAEVHPHWRPENGKAYKVLWEKTFTEKVRESWFRFP